MKKAIVSWFWAAIAALALNIFGCGGNPEPVTSNGDDAGMTVLEDRPQTTADAGTPVVDAGSPAVDVGMPAEDAPQVKTWAETACAGINKFSLSEARRNGEVIAQGRVTCQFDVEHPDGEHIEVGWRDMSAVIGHGGFRCVHNTDNGVSCTNEQLGITCDEVNITMSRFAWGGTSGYVVQAVLCYTAVGCPLTNR